MKLTQAFCLTLLSALAVAESSPSSLDKRDILLPMPESADEYDLKFNPALDYDKDSCYNVVAIDWNGRINPGTGATWDLSGNCRTAQHLRRNQVYSRRRCNNGICAIMYEFYFEKDQAAHGSFAGGHRHDWENIVVFTWQNRAIWVAPSCHGRYSQASGSFLKIRGTEQPYMVYHKDGGATHCFRFAKKGDVNDPENHDRHFISSPVIDWAKWPSGDRDKLPGAFPGRVTPKLFGDTFSKNLEAAAGFLRMIFDPYYDGPGSSGMGTPSSNKASDIPNLEPEFVEGIGVGPTDYLPGESPEEHKDENETPSD